MCAEHLAWQGLPSMHNLIENSAIVKERGHFFFISTELLINLWYL